MSNASSANNAAAFKVFVSHASEDSGFVRELGTRLRNDGVDAWVDEWEIKVGDSFVDKVFGAIAECDVFLIISLADERTQTVGS